MRNVITTVAVCVAISAGCSDQSATTTPSPSDRTSTGSPPEAEAPPMPDDEQSLGGERERLIARLVAAGDKAMTKDKNVASRYYAFASLYAPNDDDIERKLEEAQEGVEQRLIVGQEYDHAVAFVKTVGSEGFGGWPEVSAEMELVDLRILLDSRLVGDLHYTSAQMSGEALRIFLATPDRELSEVLPEYRRPPPKRGHGKG